MLFFSLIAAMTIIPAPLWSLWGETSFASRYYKTTDISITSDPPLTSLAYRIEYNSSSQTEPPKAKGEFRFTREDLNDQLEKIRVTRYGLDLAPLWRADIKNQEVTTFTEFRRNESEPFAPNKPLAKYVFKDGRLQHYYQRIHGFLFRKYSNTSPET